MPILTRAAALPVRSAAPAPTATAERFARAQVSPALEGALAHTPRSPVSPLEWIAPLGMAGFGVFFFSRFVGDAPGGFQAFGTLFALVWFAVLAWMIARVVRIAQAPLVRTVALVVDTHRELHGGGEHRVHTHHYVVLQDEHGARTKLACPDRLVGLVSEGDLGVAYTKADRLADFVRLEA